MGQAGGQFADSRKMFRPNQIFLDFLQFLSGFFDFVFQVGIQTVDLQQQRVLFLYGLLKIESGT